MAKEERVHRPLRQSEYEIRFASRDAKKRWTDLKATVLGPLADSWDFLTRTPRQRTPTNYPLKGELAKVTRNGVNHARGQHKPTAKGDARIWFYVHEQIVYLEQVHTKHPNETNVEMQRPHHRGDPGRSRRVHG